MSRLNVFEDDYQKLMAEVAMDEIESVSSSHLHVDSTKMQQTTFIDFTSGSTMVDTQAVEVPVINETEEDVNFELKDSEVLFEKWQARVLQLQLDAESLFTSDHRSALMNDTDSATSEEDFS